MASNFSSPFINVTHLVMIRMPTQYTRQCGTIRQSGCVLSSSIIAFFYRFYSIIPMIQLPENTVGVFLLGIKNQKIIICPIDMKQMTLEREFHKLLLYAKKNKTKTKQNQKQKKT